MESKKTTGFELSFYALSHGVICLVPTASETAESKVHWLLKNFDLSEIGFWSLTRLEGIGRGRFQNKMNCTTFKGMTYYARKMVSFLGFHFLRRRLAFKKYVRSYSKTDMARTISIYQCDMDINSSKEEILCPSRNGWNDFTIKMILSFVWSQFLRHWNQEFENLEYS